MLQESRGLPGGCVSWVSAHPRAGRRTGKASRGGREGEREAPLSALGWTLSSVEKQDKLSGKDREKICPDLCPQCEVRGESSRSEIMSQVKEASLFKKKGD